MTNGFRITLGALALSMSTLPAFAEGDAAAGEQAFTQCQACHIVADADGEVLAGRNSRTGPNLYGMIGRQAGSVEDFRYGNSLVEAGEEGLIWDEETFVAYVQDPNGFLQEYLDNRRARGQMSFRVRGEDTARDLYAFLATFSDLEDEDEEEEDAEAM